MISYLDFIPQCIIRDIIIPYTYCTQPAALLEDLRSYYLTMSWMKDLYREKCPICDEEESDMALLWMRCDICMFLNNDQPTMFGIVEFYRIVFRRMYMNQSKLLCDVVLDGGLSHSSENFNDIKVSIGLLNPTERLRLEGFLESGIGYDRA
jgi:hypothetical protein